MAEVQTSTQSGELAQRFIEFVMMQAQNAALFLGQIPNPKTGEGEVNLELAKMFIDQLAMIQEKLRGKRPKVGPNRRRNPNHLHLPPQRPKRNRKLPSQFHLPLRPSPNQRRSSRKATARNCSGGL